MDWTIARWNGEPYTDLPVNAHPQSGDSQGQEMFLAASADYDTECSNIYIYI